MGKINILGLLAFLFASTLPSFAGGLRCDIGSDKVFLESEGKQFVFFHRRYEWLKVGGCLLQAGAQDRSGSFCVLPKKTQVEMMTDRDDCKRVRIVLRLCRDGKEDDSSRSQFEMELHLEIRKGLPCLLVESQIKNTGVSPSERKSIAEGNIYGAALRVEKFRACGAI